MRDEPEIVKELRNKEHIEKQFVQSKVRKNKFQLLSKIIGIFIKQSKNESLLRIKKVAIETIAIGIFLTILIESYYVFIIKDMTFFDTIVSFALVL